ncbi:PLAT/LH2 domain-containing protein [Streptomyces sp. NPDC015661]|uniref:PLAT/LH2 domain-containing protein n=1 Tax=Streptomyces sp. NPDC015661 TaxID=3364961 RepID=UPI0036F68295
MEYQGWAGTGQVPPEHGPEAVDADRTEVLPRPAAAVPMPLPAPPPSEAAPSTRPLPRIDTPSPTPPRRRRPPAGVLLTGAVVIVCAGAGLAAGALLSSREGPDARPLGAPAPTTTPRPETAAASAAGIRKYAITIKTSPVSGAGTDSEIQGRLTDTEGRTSPWTVLDTAGHDDFEAGGTGTYTIDVPRDFGSPATFQLWKGDGDDWAPYSLVGITGPDGSVGMWGADSDSARYWITDGPPPASETGGEDIPHYGHYSPAWPVT